jgi:H+/Cl- antiporter ClcA
MMGDMESGQFTPHKIHDIAEPGQPIMHEQGQPQRSRQQQQQQKQQQQQHSTITVGKQKQKRGTASALKMRSKSVFAEDLWVGVGVGVLTGTAVVIFSSVVHILQEAFGVVSMSPSAISDHATGPLSNAMIWAEQKGVQALPQQVRCLVTPVLGGIISTAILALFSPPLPPASVEQVRGWIERGVPESDDDILPTQQQKQQEQQHVDVDVDVDVDANRARGNLWRASLSPSQRIAAAAVVLATGNSLGPEGPSVEIGRAWAKLLSSPQTLKAALAAGMAAGVSAGFDAPISGVLFALETSKQSSSGNSQDEPDQISMSQDALAGVVVAAVVAAVASRLGLGEAPALFAIPRYQLGAYFELPFYAGLGALCGAASLAFLSIEKKLSEVSLDAEGVGVPGLLLPSLASLVTGLVALSYPEVMYQGFANFDKILGAGEANASGTSDAYTAAALLQIATAKVFVTALSRSFGLQGGIYAPSLFIGAALGLAFGTFSQQFLEALISNLGVMLSAPQTYALAGMAATLAAVCRIPLTASLLLFEITRDYEIMLPILVAVAVSFGSSTTAYSIMENSDSVFDADDGLDGSIEPSSTNPEKIEVESERFKA